LCLIQAIDKSSSGKITGSVLPPPHTRYVSASAGTSTSYFLRADGVIDRVKGKVVGEIIPPPVHALPFLYCTEASISILYPPPRHRVSSTCGIALSPWVVTTDDWIMVHIDTFAGSAICLSERRDNRILLLAE
jgi:hypothetical protein